MSWEHLRETREKWAAAQHRYPSSYVAVSETMEQLDRLARVVLVLEERLEACYDALAGLVSQHLTSTTDGVLFPRTKEATAALWALRAGGRAELLEEAPADGWQRWRLLPKAQGGPAA